MHASGKRALCKSQQKAVTRLKRWTEGSWTWSAANDMKGWILTWWGLFSVSDGKVAASEFAIQQSMFYPGLNMGVVGKLLRSIPLLSPSISSCPWMPICIFFLVSILQHIDGQTHFGAFLSWNMSHSKWLNMKFACIHWLHQNYVILLRCFLQSLT